MVNLWKSYCTLYCVRFGGAAVRLFTARYIGKKDAGTAKMKEIADAIATGARAFLFAEYRILIVFAVDCF